MSELSELYIIIFGSIGWLLTIYFGFYRFKQYQWAKRKVQYDLFTKINQSSYQLFLRVTTLSGIENKNEKIRAKRYGVLIKYVENMNEKVFLMRGRMVSPEIGSFWINGILNELRVLMQQDERFLSELQDILDREVIVSYPLHTLLDAAKNGGEVSASTIGSLYTNLTQ